MSIHKIGTIVKASTHDNPTVNRDLAEYINVKMSADPNPTVAAQGPLINSKWVLIKAAITADIDAVQAAKNSNTVKHTQNVDTVKAINNGGVVLMQAYPASDANYAIWKAKGYKVTMIEVPDQSVPEIVVHGAMSNGNFLGDCHVIFDRPVGGESFTLRMTKGDPSVDAGYVLILFDGNVSDFTSTSVTFPVPAAYWGCDLFFKVTAHNGAGPGPESTPFGGRKINGQS